MLRARRRVLLSLLVMMLAVLAVQAVATTMLYRAAVSEERERLRETAQSQARLIEAIARHDRAHSAGDPEAAAAATLGQVMDAHRNYEGFGRSGEFTLGARDGDQITFLLSHRHYDLDNPQPVPWDSDLAEPMRQALSGRSGTIEALDYRGVTVLAAHEPVDVLDLGIVAKIDLAEIRTPYLRAGALSALLSTLLVLVSAALSLSLTNPVLRQLQDNVAALERALAEVKTLRGILPICSFCKKIRDDDGYWSQVEVYVSERSHADFSHGICPDCMEEHYPGLMSKQELDEARRTGSRDDGET